MKLLRSFAATVVVLTLSVVSAQGPGFLRVVNEANSTIDLYDDVGILIQSVAQHQVGAYISFNTSTNNFTLVTPWETASISYQTWTGESSYITLLAGEDPVNGLSGALFDDAEGLIPDGPGAIDQCQLRVLNGYPSSVFVYWVSSECHNCMVPPAFQPNSVPFLSSGPSLSSYASVTCDKPIVVQVTTADGAFTQESITVEAVEHGSYTVVVRAVGGSGDATPLLAVVADVPGVWPYTPIIVAGAVLLSLGIAHRLLGYALVLSGGVTAPAGSSRRGGNDKRRTSSVSSTGSSHSGALAAALAPLWSFLGYPDMAAERAARRAKKDREAAEADGDAALLGRPGASAALTDVLMEGYMPNGNLTAPESDEAAEGSGNDVSGGSGAVSAPPGSTKPGSAGRIRAVDSLRGCCLAIMVFVNYGGGGYWFFNHSDWNGLTWADLVFPIFVWTAALSISISFHSLRSKGARKRDLVARVVKRSLKLYALGLFINNGAQLGQWRVLGVLQYFAVSQLVVGLVDIFVPVLASSSSSAAADGAAGGSGGSFYDAASGMMLGKGQQQSSSSLLTSVGHALWMDVGRYALQWGVMAVLAAIYLCLQYLLPVPGCPIGYIGPGGLGDQGQYPGCTGGAHRYIDINFFGIAHIYHGNDGNGNPVSAATCAARYGCAVYDPEGALGWISAAWMGWLGMQAGRVIVAHRQLMQAAAQSGRAADRRAAVKAHVARWVTWGLVCGAIGGGLCGFSKEDGLIPLNKNLWSPSFVLVMVRALSNDRQAHTRGDLCCVSLPRFHFCLHV